MQEDLVIMRNLILQTDPDLDTSSKAFSRLLMSQFKLKHPNCMESERSLSSKLKESSHLHPVSVPKEPTKQKLIQPEPVSAPKAAQFNPAVNIMSDIEGFSDWNLGMVRDFISCMDRARRKYSDMKETDPQMKLVPLLLVEWKNMYPDSVETVRTFLVRIRYLKSNKESIKAKLGEHDLLPRMSNDDQGASQTPQENDVVEVKIENENVQNENASSAMSHNEKFVWDSNSMMPNVIATRAKAIAKQKREAENGKRISYAKIWIKEFQKIYPNCPYTANNLSVHYWYWTSRQSGQENQDKAEMLKKVVPEAMDIDEVNENSNWTEEQLQELKRIGDKVKASLKSVTKGQHLQLPKLLHSVWISLHPESSECEDSLWSYYNRPVKSQTNSPVKSADISEKLQLTGFQRWTPSHNKCLRIIVKNLKENNKYTRRNVIIEWEKQFSRLDWDYLSGRIDDCGFSQPVHLVKVQEKKLSKSPKLLNKSSSKTSSANEKDADVSGLNARGQMRWTQKAVSDLLECHKLGLKAKTSYPSKKLADLVHQKFKQRHPYCPIAPNVLLTKCYILR